jgi:hypothetical protein
VSISNDWLRLNLEGQAKELREREQRCRNAYTRDSALHAATNDLADCHAAAALIYETALRQVGAYEHRAAARPAPGLPAMHLRYDDLDLDPARPAKPSP